MRGLLADGWQTVNKTKITRLDREAFQITRTNANPQPLHINL